MAKEPILKKLANLDELIEKNTQRRKLKKMAEKVVKSFKPLKNSQN